MAEQKLTDMSMEERTAYDKWVKSLPVLDQLFPPPGGHLQQWISLGKPGYTPPPLPQTPEGMAEAARTAYTTEGRIPYQGNEYLQDYLTGLGWELVTKDELGPLPNSKKYYQPKTEEAEAEVAGEVRPEPWKYPAEPARGGYEYVFNPTWGWIEQPIGQAEGMTEYQRAQVELAQGQQAWEQQQTAQATAESGAMSEWQQWQSQFLPWQAQQEYGLEQQGYGLEQQGLAQQQQNTLAQMAAQPASWLQHAATSGTPPVVQPWMLPLQRQDYPEFEEFRAGQPIPGWPEQFTGTNAAAYGGQPYAGQPYQPQGFEPFSYTPPPTPAIPEIPDYQAMYAEWQQQQEEARLQEEYTRLQAVSAQPTLRSLGAYGGQAPPSPSPTPTPTPTTTRTATAVHQAEEEVRKRQLRTEPTKLTGGAYIPGFQYGGWVTQPTTARLAEKEPELVTPLSSMTGSSGGGGSSWFDRLKAALSTAKPAGTPTEPEPEYPTGYRPPPFTRPGLPGEIYTPSGQTQPQPTEYPTGYRPPPFGAPGQQPGGIYTPSQQVPPSQYPLGGMPELTRPSRQYQARMSPSQRAQFYAYKQARTGATPEDTAWMLWNMAPPGGGYSGLSYRR